MAASESKSLADARCRSRGRRSERECVDRRGARGGTGVAALERALVAARDDDTEARGERAVGEAGGDLLPTVDVPQIERLAHVVLLAEQDDVLREVDPEARGEHGERERTPAVV